MTSEFDTLVVVTDIDSYSHDHRRIMGRVEFICEKDHNKPLYGPMCIPCYGRILGIAIELSDKYNSKTIEVHVFNPEQTVESRTCTGVPLYTFIAGESLDYVKIVLSELRRSTAQGG